ncbi:MAG: tetratricopeptide repeat protein [Thermoanaerobaculia bacterium]|nr:tetratricopeptide repeat protein [Thermoanaerobaculia bacterium]
MRHPAFYARLIAAALCLLFVFAVSAQSPERRQALTPEEVQKLKTRIAEELKTAKPDTAKVRLQMQLAGLTARDNLNEAIKLGQEGVALAEKTAHVETIARACQTMGNIFLTNNRYDNALEYFNKGLPLAEKTGIAQIQQSYYNNLGVIYDRKGVYEKALDYYRKSYSLIEKLPVPPGRRAVALMQVGQVQSRTGKYRESNESYQKALGFAEQAQDWEKVSGIWFNIGNNYNELSDTQQAEAAFAKSQEYRDKKKAPSPANSKSANN